MGLKNSKNRLILVNADHEATPINIKGISDSQKGRNGFLRLEGSCSIHLSYERNSLFTLSYD